MKLAKEDYEIISECLIDIIDWDKIYDDTLDVSKTKFTKDDILDSIKRLIRDYPNFDISGGRLECGSGVFRIHYGILNDYIYIISNGDSYNWFLTEENLLNTLRNHENNGLYCVYFNYIDYLRINKIKKIRNRIECLE